MPRSYILLLFCLPSCCTYFFLYNVCFRSGIIEAPHFFLFFNRYGSFFYSFQKLWAVFLVLRNPCFFAALLIFSFKLSSPYTAFCFSHIRLRSHPRFFVLIPIWLDSLHCLLLTLSQHFLVFFTAFTASFLKCYVTFVIVYVSDRIFALCSTSYGGFSHKYTIRLIYSY